MAFTPKLFCSKSVFSLILIFSLWLSADDAFAADAADAGKKKTAPPPDTIVFTNGDQLSGKFVREVSGTVVFHSDIVGDVSVSWDKIKELRSSSKFVVLQHELGVRAHRLPDLAMGTISVVNSKVQVHGDNANALIAPVPVKSAQYIVDEVTFDRQVARVPSFWTGWNGTITAGTTIVQATQNQYTFTGAATLARVIPTVSWLDTRNRTTADYSQTYGEITQPAFTSGGVFTPATDTKSSIFHADAERDQYFATRFYVLAQTAFDHNFSLGLSLQQIYGGGIGWTAVKQAKQTLDFKGTLQYEKQSFDDAIDGTDQDLIGSTFSVNYALKLQHSIVFNQQVSYIPAYNNVRAYSASESNTLAFPFYKNFSFSIGTIDTYLNDPPPAEPPTKRNSFQFTTGVTYNIKSKY